MRSKSTAQANLFLGEIKQLIIPFPSLEEQEKIVNKIEQLFTLAGQIEQRVKDAQTRINNLTQSILAKAFKGELVPQDPNDEPASELLARIQKEREAAAALSKAAKKGTRKTTKKSTPPKQKKAAPEKKPFNKDVKERTPSEPYVGTKKQQQSLDFGDEPAQPTSTLPETDAQWMRVMRSAYNQDNPWLNHEQIQRLIADALEVKRLSPQRKEAIDKAIKTACKWQVLYKEAGEYCLFHTAFEDYTPEQLDVVLAKVMRKGKVIAQEEVLGDLLAGLGFVEDARARDKFKGYVNSGIRRKVLRRDGGGLVRM